MIHPWSMPDRGRGNSARALAGKLPGALAVLMLCGTCWAAPPPSGALSCAPTPPAGSMVINEINDNNSSGLVDYLEIKVLQNGTNLSGFQLCSRDNPTGGSTNCVALGTGAGYWQTSPKKYDNNSPAGNTTFDSPTWIVYDSFNPPSSKGEVVLVDSANRVVDYIGFSNNAGDCADASKWYWSVTSACRECVDNKAPSQKDFARVPDGSGGFVNNGDIPSEGYSNDGVSSFGMLVDNSTPVNGGTVTFTLSVSTGATSASGLSVIDLLPAGLTYLSSTPPAGTTYASGSGVWTIGSIAGSTTMTMTITARVTQTGTITNTATLYRNGINTGRSVSVALNVASGFNAVDTGQAEATGKIFTKVAGTAFALKLAALAGSGVATSFNGDVKAELVAGNDPAAALDASGCPVGGSAIALVNPVTLASGLATANFAAVAEAWRNVRVRITYPASGPGTPQSWCSADNFAIRPNKLAAAEARDDDAATPGTTRLLNVAAAAATPTHKAGQYFTLRATAVNSAGATTTQYTTQPTLSLEACLLPVGGVLPSAAAGTFVNSAGAVRSDTASIPEAGAFQARLTDTGFAQVDSADGTPVADQRVQSDPFTIGRFTPDHFAIDATRSTIANRGDLPATTTSGAIGAGATVLPVASSSGFAIGDKVIVFGAGAGGGPLVTTVAATGVGSLTLGDPTITDLAAVQNVFRSSDLTTTIIPPIAAGATLVPVASSAGLAVGDKVVVVGAGNGGGPLASTVAALAPGSVTLADATTTALAVAQALYRPGFTYLGEPLWFVAGLRAVNAAGVLTQNYEGFVPASWTALDPATPATSLGLAATSLAGTVSTPLSGLVVATGVSGWKSGIGSIAAEVSLTRPSAPAGPYPAASFGVFPKDADGIMAAPSQLNLDADNAVNAGAQFNGSFERAYVGSASLRYGRIILRNAYGSEKLALDVPVTAQYWDGAVWRTNSLDSTTPLRTGAALACDGAGACRCFGASICPTLLADPDCTSPTKFGVGACTDVPTIYSTTLSGATGNVTASSTAPQLPAGTALSAGLSTIRVAAPVVAGLTVSGGINLNLIVPSWLQTSAGNPLANLTFGIYKGSGRFIYRREVR